MIFILSYFWTSPINAHKSAETKIIRCFLWLYKLHFSLQISGKVTLIVAHVITQSFINIWHFLIGYRNIIDESKAPNVLD